MSSFLFLHHEFFLLIFCLLHRLAFVSANKLTIAEKLQSVECFSFRAMREDDLRGLGHVRSVVSFGADSKIFFVYFSNS